MKTIKQKLLVSFLALVTAAALICGGVGIAFNYTNAKSLLQETLTASASVAAERVSFELAAYRNAIAALGMNPALTDETISVCRKGRDCLCLGRVLRHGARQFVGCQRQQPDGRQQLR